MVGGQHLLDAFVGAILGAGLSLHSLEVTREPLESLFFMLTEMEGTAA